MRSEITVKQDWVGVEITNGTYYIPTSELDIPLVLALTEVTSNPALPDDLKLFALRKLQLTLQGRLPPYNAILSVEIKKGYGVRLIDETGGTDWEIYTNMVEAKARLEEAKVVGKLCQEVTLIDSQGGESGIEIK
jgi:hypothetical protein